MQFRGDMKNYYYGKICEKHPAENGLRNLSRRVCVACARVSVAKSIKKRKNKEK